MIVSIGEAFLKGSGTDLTDSSLKVSGKALEVALECARAGRSVLFAGAVSHDPGGLRILEFLIDNCIFFDPVFCNDPKPTLACENAGNPGIMMDCCIFSITEERLESIFTLNSDIKQVFVGGLCLNDVKVRRAVAKVLARRPELEIIIDTGDNGADCSGFESLHNARFEDSIATWL